MGEEGGVMAEGAKFKNLVRFSADFTGADAMPWHPKFSWLQYELPGGDAGPEQREALTVDLKSLQSLLEDHGFLFPDQATREDDGERALRVVEAILFFTDKTFTVSGPTPENPDKPITLTMSDPDAWDRIEDLVDQDPDPC